MLETFFFLLHLLLGFSVDWLDFEGGWMDEEGIYSSASSLLSSSRRCFLLFL